MTRISSDSSKSPIVKKRRRKENDSPSHWNQWNCIMSVKAEDQEENKKNSRSSGIPLVNSVIYRCSCCCYCCCAPPITACQLIEESLENVFVRLVWRGFQCRRRVSRKCNMEMSHRKRDECPPLRRKQMFSKLMKISWLLDSARFIRVSLWIFINDHNKLNDHAMTTHPAG